MTSKEEALAKISVLPDGEDSGVSTSLAGEIRQHLRSCARCAALARSLRQNRGRGLAFRALDRPGRLPAAERAKLLEAFQRDRERQKPACCGAGGAPAA